MAAVLVTVAEAKVQMMPRCPRRPEERFPAWYSLIALMGITQAASADARSRRRAAIHAYGFKSSLRQKSRLKLARRMGYSETQGVATASRSSRSSTSACACRSDANWRPACVSRFRVPGFQKRSRCRAQSRVVRRGSQRRRGRARRVRAPQPLAACARSPGRAVFKKPALSLTARSNHR